jgi:DNA-binding MarR family transcriptional regulator
MAEAYEDEPIARAGGPGPKPSAVWTAKTGVGKDMPPLAGSVGFLVRIVQLQSFQLFYRRFDNSGLSIGALTTLGAIHANPGIRHGVLADALMIKRPNFTKVINGLEKEGLIARAAPRGDKRTTALSVTKKGVRKLETMHRAILAHHAEMVANLTPAEHETLLDLLQRLSRHLQTLLDRNSQETPKLRAIMPAK